MSNPLPNNSKKNNVTVSKQIDVPTLAGAFILSVLLLTLILPRAESVGYFYTLGEPWRYASLYAAEQFPVYKTADELKAEQDGASAQVQPYFALDSTVAARQVAAFRADYAAGKFAGVPPGYAAHIADALTRLYEAGVMSMADAENLAKFSPTHIRIVRGNEAESREAATVYSIRTAYDEVMKTDTAQFRREVMAACNIPDYLLPNITLDQTKTHTAVDEAVAGVSQTHGLVKKGEKIIDRGEIVDEQKLKILDSFQRDLSQRNETADRGLWELIAGQGLFVLLLLLAATLYLYTFRRDILRQRSAILLIFSLVTLFPLLAHLLLIVKAGSVYLIPFALVAVFLRVFFDSRTAFATYLVTLLLTSLCLSNPYEFLCIELAAGFAVVFSISELTERAQLLRVSVVITLVTLLAALVFDLTQGIGFAGLSPTHYIYIACGGMLTLMGYPLLYLLERVFGFSSSMTMLELMNINNDILSALSQNAQGTFNHSMSVANLATDVAKKIGARVQLVRAGAFYHDIGKMAVGPTYFTENQTGVNPHDRLDDEKQSAKIIISHVTEGLRIAREHNLPKEICDFILTHHGRGKVRYFYVQWVNKHPGEQVDEAAFTYPGPNPMTKEQAILMICDGVEAASRSLKDYTAESISTLVTRIVDTIVAEGCLKRCPISFLDIELAKLTLIESLKRTYHTRISYPELKS
ncbi:MAG: HDIG domain-containing protein [Bacteroidaceae bacterium]|nr:HDIG domain-containing protein [Bacteroidaceae bacterium]